MNDAPRDELSATGQSRREAMLGELVESMDTLHRRRRARRRAGTAFGLSAAMLAFVVFGVPSLLDHESVQIVERQPDPLEELAGLGTDAPPRGAHVERVRTRHDIVADYASPSRQPVHVQRVSPRRAVTVEIIGDQKLLQMLAQMDRPTGLVRADGKVWLTAPVTDAELEKLRDTGGTGSAS